MVVVQAVIRLANGSDRYRGFIVEPLLEEGDLAGVRWHSKAGLAIDTPEEMEE